MKNDDLVINIALTGIVVLSVSIKCFKIKAADNCIPAVVVCLVNMII